jgi:hypothetical protein
MPDAIRKLCLSSLIPQQRAPEKCAIRARPLGMMSVPVVGLVRGALPLLHAA